ncbi:MAG: hypothetical protein LBK95_00815, partial [Bifidobacteriaceae bacterium]|nr:hypothetical protein [Bifidobacteriaceae bacterium]
LALMVALGVFAVRRSRRAALASQNSRSDDAAAPTAPPSPAPDRSARASVSGDPAPTPADPVAAPETGSGAVEPELVPVPNSGAGASRATVQESPNPTEQLENN